MAEQRPAPLFVGDDLALDFLNSFAAPRGRETEWLANGADLVAWLEQAHAVPADVAARFRADAASGALDAMAAQARELRERFRAFVGNHAGEPLSSTALRDLAPFNQLLGRDESYRQIAAAPRRDTEVTGGDRDGEDGHGALHWQYRRRWRTPETLLLPIAEAIGDLVCRKDFTLVRQCEGPTCTLWFHDVSKGHVRRWCSMAVCGNRAKAAAHRARQRPPSSA
ncbi:MAG: CGNR zinc finger domain-containing protein [Rhodospirillales bacterium]|nr:CGNR zinc finger domain-containing protein [Rhodospirillales bacterium]